MNASSIKGGVALLGASLFGFFLGTLVRSHEAENPDEGTEISRKLTRGTSDNSVASNDGIPVVFKGALDESREGVDPNQKRREIMDSMHFVWLQAMEEEMRPMYEEQFEKLGITKTEQDDLFTKLKAIYEAKLLQDRYAGELSKVRNEYSLQLERLLRDDYSLYVSFEESSKARREVEVLDKRASLASDDRSAITELIQKYGVYTEETLGWHGTAMNDKLAALYGRPAILNRQLKELEVLVVQSEKLLAEAEQMNFAPESVVALKQYYGAERARQEARIEDSKDKMKSRLDPTHIPSSVREQLKRRGIILTR